MISRSGACGYLAYIIYSQVYFVGVKNALVVALCICRGNYSINHDKLPGFRRKSGVGAALSQHQYRTLSEETHPKAHPVRSGDCHLVNVARGTHLVQFLQHINCMKVRGIELHSLSVILNRQHCVPARLICLTEAIERI
jgi:hypothetical protein